MLVKSRNFSKHFISYNPRSVLFGSDGTAGYLICFSSTVFFSFGGDSADHTSRRYLVIFTSTDLCCMLSESGIIREKCNGAVTITRIQWSPLHRYLLEKMSLF